MSPDAPRTPALSIGSTAPVAALIETWLGTHRSANTRAAYGRDLHHFAAWCVRSGVDPLAARTDHLVAYQREEHAGDADATTARRLSALASFYRYLVGTGRRRDNPVRHVPRPTAPGPSVTDDLDEHDAGAMLAAAQSAPRDAVLVGMLLSDGLKLAEVLGADVEDLADPPATMTVDRRGHPEAIALCASTSAAVESYLAGRTSGPLLLSESPSRTPGRLTRFGADYLLKHLGVRAGVATPVSANTLRRSFVTRAHAAGVPLDAIRDFAGHSDRRTTRRLLDTEHDTPATPTPKEVPKC